jgi:hypothetical protein
MQFLELTMVFGRRKIFINPNFIRSFILSDCGTYTEIYLSNNMDDRPQKFLETPEEIIQKIND